MRFWAMLLLCLWGGPAGAEEASLSRAAGSPLTGLTFDDRPYLLPEHPEYLRALADASLEAGVTCARREAFAWDIGTRDQPRIDRIYASLLDRLRQMRFALAPVTGSRLDANTNAVLASSPEKSVLMVWSAGKAGLLLLLCEARPVAAAAPVPDNTPFTLVGSWHGSYSCTPQGLTGATLRITHVTGAIADGIFEFYPLPRNPSLPRGSYFVRGQYDAALGRLLLTPGTWRERPADFEQAVMLGSIDPASRRLSIIFQGIAGCTSFEASWSASQTGESTAR